MPRLSAASPFDSEHTITGARHPDTSLEAARKVIGHTGTARRRILVLLRLNSYTDEELQNLLGLSPNSARPRRVELVDAGYVEASPSRRPTSSGSPATVWQITTAGRDALRAVERRGERW